MEYRTLGGSGLMVPALVFGTATFGGASEFLRKWGATDVAEATEMVDICLDAGCNVFDTADSYSSGLSEEILGQAVKGRRDRLLIATKTGMPMGPGVNERGTSREKIVRSCEASLKRLGTDVIDLYQLHAFDALTPIEEMLRALDSLMRAGKIRYYGVSNYSGWHLMKMIALADRHGFPRPVTHQVYYSLVAREFEWELMPLGLDQNVGTLVWSPLSGSKLSGKVGRNRRPPEDSRAATDASWPVPDDQLFAVTDVLEAVSAEVGRSIPQVALAWLLARPTVSGIAIGARNAAQLKDNLAAADLKLSADQIARLDAASAVRPVYPYWHQRRTSPDRNPPPVG
ncbi:aldo/keto reductase [Prosthecomicrobium sp. N25]|uniref:aldo/keto reductase n=1 Tax=Prosthecomicrobium sp. N25 TaxID=3129254 RepID=UPI00307742E5